MKYGFIGLGNMAGAIIRGMYRSRNFTEDLILGFNRSSEKTEKLAKETGLAPCRDMLEIVDRADVVILAVKPQGLPDILPEIAGRLKDTQLLISIAAGKGLSYYEESLSSEVPVIRVMPNINAKAGQSVTALCGGTYCKEKHMKIAKKIFSSVGTVYELEEDQIPAFSAIAGASGAFIHLYIDALASAGVKAGFSRDFSEHIACETVKGSAELTLKSNEHPIALMDQVCSPGGTTIEGVHVLKKLGFETAVQQAIEAIIKKDRELGK